MARPASYNLSLGSKDLLPWETSALSLYVFGVETNWSKLFQAAAFWTDEAITKQPKLFKQYVSTWKNSDKVEKEIKRLEYYRDQLLQDARLEAFEDGKKSAQGATNTTTESQTKMVETAQKKGFVDYTDPKAQKQKLNEIINNAGDSDEALDALKVIIQGQKNDQEAAKQNQVQRFYTPLRCHECPLYLKAKEKDRPRE